MGSVWERSLAVGAFSRLDREPGGDTWLENYLIIFNTGLMHAQNFANVSQWNNISTQAYIPKRHTLIQVLPPANVSGCFKNATFFRVKVLNANMHERVTKEFAYGKYLNECMPFGYVNP